MNKEINYNEMINKIPMHISSLAKEFIADFIKQILNKYETKINKIYLHGFYISGNFNKISEIDLIIVIDTENQDEYKKIRDDIFEIKYNLEEKCDNNWHFDITFDTWDNMDNKQSIILYEK